MTSAPCGVCAHTWPCVGGVGAWPRRNKRPRNLLTAFDPLPLPVGPLPTPAPVAAPRSQLILFPLSPHTVLLPQRRSKKVHSPHKAGALPHPPALSSRLPPCLHDCQMGPGCAWGAGSGRACWRGAGFLLASLADSSQGWGTEVLPCHQQEGGGSHPPGQAEYRSREGCRPWEDGFGIHWDPLDPAEWSGGRAEKEKKDLCLHPAPGSKPEGKWGEVRLAGGQGAERGGA